MWFSTIIWKNVTRRPLRSALTVLAIAVGVGTVVAFVGLAGSFEESFMSLYRRSGFDLIVTRAGGGQSLSSTLPEDLGPKIAAIPGVTEVFPSLAEGVSIEELPDRLVILQGWPPGSRVIEMLTMVAGRTLEVGDTKSAIVGVDLLAALNKKVGDKVTIFPQEVYEIVGSCAGATWESNGIILPLSELQRIMGRANQVNAFGLRLEKSGDPEFNQRVAAQIVHLGHGMQVKTPAEHVKSLRELQLAKAMSWLVSSIALVIGIFGMMNTMVMSVQERTREIGVLRAIGWSPRRVVRMILAESVILSMIGAVLGNIGAVVLLRLANELPTVKGHLSTEVQPMLVAQAFGIAAAVGVICAAFPARRAARMLPTTALRHE